jgi:hypothetical protein
VAERSTESDYIHQLLKEAIEMNIWILSTERKGSNLMEYEHLVFKVPQCASIKKIPRTQMQGRSCCKGPEIFDNRNNRLRNMVVVRVGWATAQVDSTLFLCSMPVR